MSGAVGALSVFIGAVSCDMPGVRLSRVIASGTRIEKFYPCTIPYFIRAVFLLSWLNRKAGPFHVLDKLLVLVTGIPILCITYCFYNAVY